MLLPSLLPMTFEGSKSALIDHAPGMQKCLRRLILAHPRGSTCSFGVGWVVVLRQIAGQMGIPLGAIWGAIWGHPSYGWLKRFQFTKSLQQFDLRQKRHIFMVRIRGFPKGPAPATPARKVRHTLILAGAFGRGETGEFGKVQVTVGILTNSATGRENFGLRERGNVVSYRRGCSDLPELWCPPQADLACAGQARCLHHKSGHHGRTTWFGQRRPTF